MDTIRMAETSVPMSSAMAAATAAIIAGVTAPDAGMAAGAAGIGPHAGLRVERRACVDAHNVECQIGRQIGADGFRRLCAGHNCTSPIMHRKYKLKKT